MKSRMKSNPSNPSLRTIVRNLSSSWLLVLMAFCQYTYRNADLVLRNAVERELRRRKLTGKEGGGFFEVNDAALHTDDGGSTPWEELHDMFSGGGNDDGSINPDYLPDVFVTDLMGLTWAKKGYRFSEGRGPDALNAKAESTRS
jgi:hypothetical protein